MKPPIIRSHEQAVRYQALAEQAAWLAPACEVFNNDSVPLCGNNAPPEIQEWLQINGYEASNDPQKSHLILLVRGALPFSWMKAVAEYWKHVALHVAKGEN